MLSIHIYILYIVGSPVQIFVCTHDVDENVDKEHGDEKQLIIPLQFLSSLYP